LAITRTKRQRKNELKALLKRIITLLVLGVLLLASLYLYDYITTTKRLAVRDIRVEGLTRTNPGEIEKMLSDLKGQNIFQAPLDDYGRRLRMLPRVAEANLKMVLPHTVVCTIEERKPVALVLTNKFMEVDCEGMLLKEDELTSNLDLPIITGLVARDMAEGRISSNPNLQSALKSLSLCKMYDGRFASQISEIKTGSRGVSIVSLKEGAVVMLGDSDFENRLKKYFMLKDTIERNESATKLIDLRFDDQIVLRSSF